MSSDSAPEQPFGGPVAGWPAGLLLGFKLCLLGSLILAAAVLIQRRWSGELARPLATGWLALAAIVAVLAARFARAGMPCWRSMWSEAPLSITAAACSSTMACVVFASALSLPGSSSAGLAALWAIVAAGEGAWWISHLRVRRQSAATDISDIPLLVQQARRDRHGDGRERVVGWIRVDLAAGQRVAQVHVAFCPPLEHAPTVELRQTAGPAARLKLGQALVYGARFELKLPQPGPASIVLEYTATTAGPASTHQHPSAAALPAAS